MQKQQLIFFQCYDATPQ